MEEENITRIHFAIVCEDQEAHVILLRNMFAAADTKLTAQRTVPESLRLIRAFQAHIDLRREALDLLAWQIIQLREIAKRQHALLREMHDLLEDSREDTRFTSSSPRAGGEIVGKIPQRR